MVARAVDMTLADGFAGVMQTVRIIVALACRGANDKAVLGVARLIARRVSDAVFPNRLARAVAIFWHVKRLVAYTPDPNDVELVQTASRTITRRRGDCDDFAVLICSLALVLGLRPRVVIVRTGASTQFNHVYAEVFAGGQWITLDPTTQESTPGYKIPGVAQKMIFTLPCAA